MSGPPTIVRCNRCARVFAGSHDPGGYYGPCSDTNSNGGVMCRGMLHPPMIDDGFGNTLQAALIMGGFVAVCELLKTSDGRGWGWAYLDGRLLSSHTTRTYDPR